MTTHNDFDDTEYSCADDALCDIARAALKAVLSLNHSKHGEFGFLQHSRDYHVSKAAGHLRKYQDCKETGKEQEENHLAHAFTRLAMAMFCEDTK